MRSVGGASYGRGMGIATWKDLCIDAVDDAALAAFWGALLGLRAEEVPSGHRLSGAAPEQTVWINRVPEPVSTKQRVHLDIHASCVEDVLELGASPFDLESFAWKIVRDPEGGELCVFERNEVPDYRLYEIVVDSAEPERIATWWADVLGGSVGHEDGTPWWWVEQVPAMPFESLVFPPVPEPKIVKNRVHWDVWADPQLLVGDGASVVRERDDEIGWTVLADPEGNEFCAFAEPVTE